MKDKIFTDKSFPTILGLTALLIAMCAAFFSVYGISTLFAGAFISAVVMSSSLEIGKLVGVTFLYRYWTKCSKMLKGYLVTAALVLMVITSLGIFGYLSAAYQKSAIEFSVTQEKIKISEQQITQVQQNIDSLMNYRTSQNTNQMNEAIVRNPLLFKQFQQQIADTDANIEKETKKKDALIESVNTLKLGTAEKKDVQTFKFVADALGVSLDSVARWFIISIIVVFDPLAICLILAYNVAVYRREDESVYDKPQVPTEPTTPQITTMLKELTPIKAETEEQSHPQSQPQPESVVDDRPSDNWFRNYFKK